MTAPGNQAVTTTSQGPATPAVPEPAASAGSLRSALRLWRLLRVRDAGRSDPQRLTGVLAVVAFAVTTAVLLLVLGGFGAFQQRAEAGGPYSDEGFYVVLAGTASVLLLVPLITLGGAAARLSMARRDERLAALRLAGATTAQVSVMTVLDATVQALAGAFIGTVGVFALIPLVLPVTFQNRPFTYAELVPEWWVFALTITGVALVSMLSAGASLRKVAITPLGVAARHTPNPLHWSRVVPIVLIAACFAVLVHFGLAGIVVLVAVLAGGFAMLNLLGPWVMSLVGRLSARRARSVGTLIAARRIIDDPKGAWRSVGGVALCTFIAGLTAAAAMFDSVGSDDPIVADLSTGGLLTLTIAGLLAAVSTGVMQAGGIIDQRTQYRALHLAGTDLTVMHAARLRQTAIPLLAAVLIATAAALVFMLPALGFGLLSSVPLLIQFLLSVVAVCLLVLAGNLASARVVRTVLA